jgi:hypothetical protein
MIPTLAINKKIINKTPILTKCLPCKKKIQFIPEGDWLPCVSSGMPCGVFILGIVNPIGYAKFN